MGSPKVQQKSELLINDSFANSESADSMLQDEDVHKSIYTERRIASSKLVISNDTRINYETYLNNF